MWLSSFTKQNRLGTTVCERLILSLVNVVNPIVSLVRQVSTIEDITRLKKLLYKTSRIKATDSYLWISPFVR